MKAVVDEGVPRELVKMLRAADCDVAAFPNEWKGMKNGKLLPVIKESLGRTGIALVVLPVQRLGDLEHLVERIALVVRNSEAGQTYLVQPHPTVSDPPISKP